MAVLKQTLYWNADPSSNVVDISGSGDANRGRAITAAESHDANDTTYERLDATGDFVSIEGEASNEVSGALQTASVSGPISFIRIIFRQKVSAVGGGTASGSTQPFINGTTRGSAEAASGSFVDHQQDFSTDPADGLPWSNAKINAQTFGVKQYVLTSDFPNYATTGRNDLSEFRVEVWGVDPVTVTATPAAGAGSASGEALAPVVDPTAAFIVAGGLPAPDQAALAAEMYAAAGVGVRFRGPYFAMWTRDPYWQPPGAAEIAWSGSWGAEQSFHLIVAVHSAPVQLDSPSEPHWLAVIAAPGKMNGFAIGITPDLRICGYDRFENNVVVYSAPGVVPVDGLPHKISFENRWRRLLLDGAVVVVDNAQLEMEMTIPTDPWFAQAMVFNGLEATTNCDCTIYSLLHGDENLGQRWDFNDAGGDTAEGVEDGIGITNPDFPGLDLDLVAGWFDPEPLFPRRWGPFPDPTSDYTPAWVLRTQYRRAVPVRPNYRPAVGAPGGFRPPEEGAPT